MTMTKKYITLSSIIVILLATLIFLYAFKDKGYSLPKFDKIENEITKIEITRNGKTMTLENDLNKWKEKESGYIVGKTYITDMTNSLQNVKIKDFVSRGNAQTLSQYNLNDENKMNVKAYDKNGKLARDIDIGSAAIIFDNVYGRKAGDKKIYLIESGKSMKDVFDKMPKDIRNTSIISILTFDLKEFTINSGGKNYTLTRKDTEEDGKKKTLWLPSWKDDAYVDEKMMSSSLYFFTYIGAEGFSEKLFKDTEWEYKIDYVKNDGEKISLYLLEKYENGSYTMATTEDDTIYLVGKEVYEKLKEAIETIIKA